MRKLKKIIEADLCLGCGLCQSVLGTDRCSMQLGASGFYYPHFKEAINKKDEALILNLCPAIHIDGENNQGVWGQSKETFNAWSTSDEIRQTASSGGVISSLCVYLLETQTVNAILHVGVKDDSYLYNELKISRTRQEVINNASSRYAPALIFQDILNILKSTTDIFAFVGKPCDIAGIKNILKKYPEYKKRIKYCFAIFCAGMPSYTGTNELLNLSETRDNPISLRYRGDGWPGYFKAKYKDGSSFMMTYNDSWGKVLNKHLNLRCKICPDGIGLLADIAVGDSWETKDGYPDFEEKEGKSFVLLRTSNGQKLFRDAVEKGYLVAESFDKEKIKDVQAYQYSRRSLVGYRILPVQILSGFILSFNNLGILGLMRKASLRMGIKNLLGTTKRFISILSK